MLGSRLFTGGLANPLDVFTLDDDGAPLSRTTWHEGIAGIRALHLTSEHLSVFYEPHRVVELFGIGESNMWREGSIVMREANTDGIILSEEKIGTVRPLVTWGSDFIHSYTVSDSGHGVVQFSGNIRISKNPGAHKHRSKFRR